MSDQNECPECGPKDTPKETLKTAIRDFQDELKRLELSGDGGFIVPPEFTWESFLGVDHA